MPSGLPMHQSVFRITKPDAASTTTQDRLRKRNRQTVSCQACRAKKLKCDRQTPCMTCQKKGNISGCTYEADAAIAPASRDGSLKNSEAQLRLQKLEAMVTSLMQSPQNASTSNGSSKAELHPVTTSMQEVSKAANVGHLDDYGTETSYVGCTHWATVLENIRELQDCLDVKGDINDEPHLQLDSQSPGIIFGASQPATLTDLCSSLPPKAEADTLIGIYFNSKQIQFLPLTHSIKFMREYEAFWKDPASASVLWISILFSILCVSMRLRTYKISDDPLGYNQSRQDLMFVRAGQALVAGGYQHARPYSVEAALLYSLCKYTKQEAPDTDVWLLMGTAARLAMKMGYHRDPRHFPKLSAFEGEMRRRVFFYVRTFDLILSFNAGLPAIIHEEECDTELPGNLLDVDFDEDTVESPPSRPTTDPTQMVYYRTKGQLMRLFSRVFRLVISFESHTYEEVMRLDRSLREAHENMPAGLKARSLASSIIDSPDLIMHRQNLESLHLKVMCVLHRQYLTHDRLNPAYEYSRRTCTETALKLLKLQIDLQIACQPGGRFYEDRWMLSSIQQQDFLLAAMIICLDLHESAKTLKTATPEEISAQADKYDMLTRAHSVWTLRTELSRDAQRALRVIVALLSRIRRPDVDMYSSSSQQMPHERPEDTSGFATNSGTPTWNMNANGSTNTSTIDTTPSDDFAMDTYGSFDMNMMYPFENAFDEPEKFNWGIIDQNLLGKHNYDDFPLDWQV